MAFSRLALVFLSVLTLTTAAHAEDPIARFCGARPMIDPGANAKLDVAKRLLNRILSTRAKVFKAYRYEYDQERDRIIRRNNRLPKSQHLPVPKELTDDQLRETEQYKTRIIKAHAAENDEDAATKRVALEEAKLAEKEAEFQKCKQEILERLRLASTRTVDQLLAIPKEKRLREENDRLKLLERQYIATLEINRKDKEVMVPILSAAVCGRRALLKELDMEARAIKRQSRLSGTDPSLDLSAIDDQREEHRLEITELKRDFKIFRARQMSCSRGEVPSITQCVMDRLRTPTRMPATCAAYKMELELLGYAKQDWD